MHGSMRGGRGGRSGPPLEISNLSNSPGKIPENSPFPFENKVIVPTHASIPPPPGGNLYSLASIFMDFVTIKISMISKFVANDLINSLCYKKLDFVEH